MVLGFGRKKAAKPANAGKPAPVPSSARSPDVRLPKGSLQKIPEGRDAQPRHPAGTAASYATMKVPVVTSDYTVGGVLKLIKSGVDEYDSLDYVYVVDNKVLTGVMSARKLFSHSHGARVGNIRDPGPIVKVLPGERAVHAAYLSLKHGVSAVPVADDVGVFHGTVTRAAILSILHRKHVEDRFARVGIHRKHAAYADAMEAPVAKSIRFRLPWLIAGLFGGMLAAGIIGSFEATLERNIILAAFLPMVVYIADAVGTQLEAFSIRDFAIHSRINFARYVLKQVLIVLVMSVALGLTALAVSLVVYGHPQVAATVGISVLFASLSSILTGLFIPFAMRRMKKDPATGSGPIGTIIQDILSVLIFFLVATALL